MAEALNSPLTLEHLAQIRDALDVIKFAEQQIELAKRAGLDVTQSESDLRDSKTKLLQIKNVYFPGM